MKRIAYSLAVATLLAAPALAQTLSAAKPTQVKATIDSGVLVGESQGDGVNVFLRRASSPSRRSVRCAGRRR